MSPTASTSEQGARPRLGWYVPEGGIENETLRYRCLHFARGLSDRFESEFFTDGDRARKGLDRLEALIAVDRLDDKLVELMIKARRVGVPVFLDLDENILSPHHSRHEQGRVVQRLLAIAPFLAAITVPSAPLADAIEEHLAVLGMTGVAVRVIPDIAETLAEVEATREAYFADMPPIKPAMPPPANGRKRIFWHGPYGSLHEYTGILGLRIPMKSLREIAKSTPVELVVASDNDRLFEILADGEEIPLRYVPLTLSHLYGELAVADVALFPIGKDEFSPLRSLRPLTRALAAKVRVLAPKLEFTAEIEDAIVGIGFRDGFDHLLSGQDDDWIESRMINAERLLGRFTLERLSKVWQSVLLAHQKAARSTPRTGRALLVFDENATFDNAMALINHLKTNKDVDYDMLVSNDLLRRNLKFHGIFDRSEVSPFFFDNIGQDFDHLLEGRSVVVMDRHETKNAQRMRVKAEAHGLLMITPDMAMSGALSRYRQMPTAPATNYPMRVPGPNLPWVEEDGSVDWLFVKMLKSAGWILDAICKEIGSRQTGSWRLYDVPPKVVVDESSIVPPPEARNLFFEHYNAFFRFRKYFPDELPGPTA